MNGKRTMKAEIINVLMSLAEDGQKRESFLKNPEAYLRKLGLSEEARRILLARDARVLDHVLISRKADSESVFESRRRPPEKL